MAFSDYAHGIYLDDTHVNVSASKLRGNIDFVVGFVGEGGDITQRPVRHTQHMDEAEEAGAAFVAYFKMVPDYYRGLVGWPEPENDPHMKLLIRQLKSGASLRRVHAVMIDISRYWHDDGSEATAQWMKDIAEHLGACVWALFKLPYFFFVRKDTVDHFPGNNVFGVWLDNIKKFSSWESAYLDADDNQGVEHIADWSQFPFPEETDKLHLGRGEGWEFWKYSNNKFTGEGVDDGKGNRVGIPLFLFAGTRAALMKSLSTNIPLPVDPPAGGDDQEPPTGGDDNDPPTGGDDQDPPANDVPLTGVKGSLVKSGLAALDAFCVTWLQERGK